MSIRLAVFDMAGTTVADDNHVAKAFQEAFQMSFEAMEKELRDYVRQSRYNILNAHFKRKLKTDTEMKAAPVSEAEAQA